jgi:subtilisin family serine protease
MDGTSMASPHVAGAAGLSMATRPRDVNGDTYVDKRDAVAVQQALIDAAVPQDGTGGFGGDPDSYPQRLINARGL